MDITSLWQSFDFKIALMIFGVYVLTDALYAYYTLSVTKKKPVTSASIGAFMHFLIAFGVLNYIQNYLYVIPLALGSWVGTYAVVRHELKSKIMDS
jgi:hypothetical protein